MHLGREQDEEVIKLKTIWVFCILIKFWIWTWYGLELKITESVCYYLSVCSGIPKVWNDNSNRPCWSPPACINHDEELHEVFVDRRACWLNQEHITSSHALLQLNINFSIGKALDEDLAKVHTQVSSNFLWINKYRDRHQYSVAHSQSPISTLTSIANQT